MKTMTTKDNLSIKKVETPKMDDLHAKTSLKMFDTDNDHEMETEINSKTLKRSPSETNRLKFIKLKSLKLSKRNTINSVENQRDQKSSKTDNKINIIEVVQNNTNQFKTLNRDSTINLISEISQEEKKSKASAETSKISPSIGFLKDNIILNGADIANLRKFTLSSVNNLNTNNSNESGEENSKFLELKINENEESQNMNTTNQFFPKSSMRDQIYSPEKKESGEFEEKKIDLSETVNPKNTKKNTKQIANAEFNNYIKHLLSKTDEDFTNDLPNELKFVLDIHKHENRLVDDVEISSLFNKYQVAHFLITIFTMLGMASGFLYYEIKLDKSINSNSTNLALDACLIVCSVSNLLFIITSILRYLLYIRLKKALVDYSKQKNLWNTNQWVPLLFEIIMSLLHPNILCKDKYFKTDVNWYLLEVEYCANDYLMIVLLLKIYVIFRSIISISDFAGERSDRVMKMFGGDSSILFAIKCILNVNPFVFILFIFFSTAVILAYMIKIIEGPVFLIDLDSQANLIDFRSFSNCIWYIFITMATVGFGDYYPKTNFGRLIGIFSAIIGTVFVSLFIIYLQRALSLNQTEKTAVNFLNRLKYKDMIKNKASLFFLNSFRYNKAKNKYLNELKNPNKNENNIKKLKKEVEATFYEKTSFNKMFKRLIQNAYELPNDYDLMNNKIKDTEKKIELLKKQGLNIKQTLEEITVLVKNLKQSKE